MIGHPRISTTLFSCIFPDLHLKYFRICIPLLVIASIVGCKDETSTIGSAYFPDTVQFQTSIRSDTGFIKLTSIARPVVTVSGQPFNITWASPMMIVGRVADANEQLESWGLLQFSPVNSDDTLAHTVGVRLLLKDVPYKYGDTTNSHIDFQVYFENKGSNSKISDSTTQLSKSDLSANPVGTFAGDFLDVKDSILAIPLDSATIMPQLSAASLRFIVTPGPTMTNARGFGTTENTADVNSIPELEYTVKYGDTTTIIYRTPVLDFHLVHDMSVTPPHEFTLRGSLGVRDSIYLNLTRLSDSLNTFTTVNNAVLVLHVDPNNTRRSNNVADTAGPNIVQNTAISDSTVFEGNGYRDPSDPTIYRFQVRALLEYWLRNPTLNFGFELWSGYSFRTFITNTNAVAVEDNTLNRWTFYGQDYPDSTKRPQIVLSYSKLH